MDFQSLKISYNAIIQRTDKRSVGRLTATILAMATSCIPIVGGPISIAIDKAGERLFSPSVEQPMAALKAELDRLAPEIDRIDALEERVQAISKSVIDNPKLTALFEDAAVAAASAILDDLSVNNVGGVQNFKNIIIDQMRLHSTATAGAVTSFDHVQVTGPARFDTDHAQQQVTDSHFSGRTGGFKSTAYIQNATLGQGVVEHHVVEGGNSIGIRVIRTVGPNDPGGAALTIKTTIGPKNQ